MEFKSQTGNQISKPVVKPEVKAEVKEETATKNTLQAIFARMEKVDTRATITMSSTGLTATIKGKNFSGKNTMELGVKVDVAIEMFKEVKA